MIKTILVPTLGDQGDPSRFATALAAARPFGAHIEFLHMRIDLAELLASAATAEVGSAIATPEWIAELERENTARAQRARRAVEQFCEREGLVLTDVPQPLESVSAAWREVTGEGIDPVIRHARVHDLSVIRSGGHGAALTPEAAGFFVMRCGRPVLLVPAHAPPARLGATVAIGWKDAPEAARAVTAAMPFLSKAGKIVLIAVDEDEPIRSADGLAVQLGWHGLKASVEHVASKRRSGVETLVAAARQAGADMLVMGAYGHSRLRQMMFGGFTQHVLTRADLPVLLFH